MNRALWTSYITADRCPAWICPVCRIGILTLTEKTLAEEETVDSKRAHSHEEWDYDWVSSVFTAWAHCNNRSCKQTFAISGTGTLEPCYGPDGETGYENAYYPKACLPMLDIFEFAEGCPDDVGKEMRAAFSLFWSFRAACAGRIRVALECLLTHLKIPKKKKSKKGKFYDLTLHDRIEELAKSDPKIGAQFIALKLLGNAGSHDSDVSQNDLLDAFEIMEHALAELIYYKNKAKRVSKLAKGLTKKHGN